MKLSKETRLSDAVTNNFRYAEVFEKYGLDYCCNGKRSIADACNTMNLDPDAVINDLINSSKTLSDDYFSSVEKWEVEHIIDLINGHFHKTALRKIDVILYLLSKVCSVHGQNHPELLEINSLFNNLSQELISHMQKEEQVVFPYILDLSKHNETNVPPFGSIENPLSVLMSEHETAGKIMDEIKQLSNNFTPPADACIKYTALFHELEDFENELHRHVHIENNILFDKARNLENEQSFFQNKFIKS